MNLDTNSYLNAKTDKSYSFNSEKSLNNHKYEASKIEKLSDEINSTGKSGYGPVKDINSIDTKFNKCSPFHPALFQDFFADNDVDQAKILAKEIINSSDKGEFADKVREFYKLINNMDKNELIETAEFLGEQMKNTNGKDNIFGSLLMGVLGELKSRENQPIYIRDDFPPAFSPEEKFNFGLIKDKNSMPPLKFVNI